MASVSKWRVDSGQWKLACEWITCRSLKVALSLFSLSLQLFWICKTQDLLDCGIVLLVITKLGKVTIEREKRASLLERWNQHGIGFLVRAERAPINSSGLVYHSSMSECLSHQPNSPCTNEESRDSGLKTCARFGAENSSSCLKGKENLCLFLSFFAFWERCK